jgi:hypothetical protein
MCASWKTKDGKGEEYNVGLLAKRLEEAKRVDRTTSRVSFEGFEIDNVITVLHSSVNFERQLPEMEQRSIVWRSTFAVAEAGKITKDALIKEINKRERACALRPERKFVLTTSLSVRPPNSVPGQPKAPENTAISGRRITFGRLPRRFYQEHESVRLTATNVVFGDLPPWEPRSRAYLPVRVSVRAHSESEAVQSALDALNLLRGIWNLYFNRLTVLRSSSGRRQPVNKLVLGPVHSLHEPSGKQANMHWYEANYVGPRGTFTIDSRRDWERLRIFERLIRRYLSRSEYREDIESAIRRYTKILDSRDWNSAFVQMWSLLEHLTCTLKANYDTTIRRALFLYQKDERDYQRQILRHLRQHRNRVVHGGYETDDSETLLYQLKNFVERVLFFHIFANPGFARLQDTAEFLSLPADLTALQRQMHLMRRALRFHEGA